MIPRFLLVDFLNPRNTISALFFPALINGLYLLIMYNFFVKIHGDLVGVGTIDRASPFRILVNVVLPLSMPVIATISLFCAVYR